MDNLKKFLDYFDEKTKPIEYVGVWAKESIPCEDPQRISDDMLEFIRKCNAIKENPYG